MGAQKYQLKNGKCFADYVDAHGLGLGYCVGNAAQQLYKAGIATDIEEREKCKKGCSWYINHICSVTNISRDEIMAMVTTITADIERDQANNKEIA